MEVRRRRSGKLGFGLHLFLQRIISRYCTLLETSCAPSSSFWQLGHLTAMIQRFFASFPATRPSLANAPTPSRRLHPRNEQPRKPP